VRSLAIAALLSALCSQGCATVPAGPATAPLATPCGDCVAGVIRFAKLSPTLWRGAQPTAEGFRNLQRAGVKTVIDLRHGDEDDALITASGMKHVRIPTRAWDPREEDLVLFFRAIQDPKDWPVFIYCWKGNDRTGFYSAAYRIVEDGWTPDDAIRELFRFDYNPFWYRIPEVLRGLDVGALKARFAAPGGPGR
jgi:protein tyrosine/serine phosphatase